MSSLETRKLSYSLAINEALRQTMAQDRSVFVLGQGLKSPWYVGNTCRGLLAKFGPRRIIDTPISENALTGAAVGAAIAGMKPVVMHPRLDFMMYGVEPIINAAANWYYMFGGKSSAPVVIWGIINRRGEQAAQHSQALQALFAHIPGLKVVMPSIPSDAKGLMVAAIQDSNPVMYIDDRWLYQDQGAVPKEIYAVPIGKGIVRKKGKDITIVGISYMAREAVKAAQELKKENISAEVIDVRTVKPLDIPLILASVKKTGRLLIAEAAWKTGGVSAEIAAQISNQVFPFLKAQIARVCLADAPAPMSRALEEEYYIDAKDIVQEALRQLGK